MPDVPVKQNVFEHIDIGNTTVIIGRFTAPAE